ncbi:MAG: hypothetical protein RDU83_06260 [bacterium]|nr:hypothetical protein [bacterium]
MPTTDALKIASLLRELNTDTQAGPFRRISKLLGRDRPPASSWPDLIALRIAPMAEAARQDLWGRSTPPFPPARGGYAKAWRWLERCAPGTSRAAARAILRWQGAMEQQFGLHLDVAAPSLTVYAPDLRGRTNLSAASGPLLRLLPHVQELSTFTGWPQEDAVAYVLTGRAPLYHWRALWTSAIGGIPQAVITLWPWGLTETTLAEALAGLLGARPGPRRVRQKRASQAPIWLLGGRLPTEEDLDLVRLMRKAGPPPPRRRGLMAYWQSLADRWPQAGGRQVSPHALRVRWARLRKDHPVLARLVLGPAGGSPDSVAP